MRTMSARVMETRWVEGGVSGSSVAASLRSQRASFCGITIDSPRVVSFIRPRSPPSNARTSSSSASLSRCHSRSWSSAGKDHWASAAPILRKLSSSSWSSSVVVSREGCKKG
jgi:hypothetical protein